jgi:hypothetical protein
MIKNLIVILNYCRRDGNRQRLVRSSSTISTQYYWGINTIDANDLNFALSVDGCHLVFNE